MGTELGTCPVSGMQEPESLLNIFRTGEIPPLSAQELRQESHPDEFCGCSMVAAVLSVGRNPPASRNGTSGIPRLYIRG